MLTAVKFASRSTGAIVYLSFIPVFSKDRRTKDRHVRIAQRFSCPKHAGIARRRGCRSRSDAAVTGTDTRRSAGVWYGSAGGAGGVGRDLRRGGKAGAGRDDSRRSRRGGGELADADGSAVRAEDGTEEAGNWRGCGSGDAVESDAAGVEELSGGECVCPQHGQGGCIARKRRGHRLRHSDAAFALDRRQADHVGAADGDLYQPYGALRSEAALRDHAGEGSRPRTGAAGG